MTIHTSAGTAFECDMAVVNQNPERLYVHIINSPIAEVAQACITELPFREYPDYTVFDSLNTTPTGGVNVCLKKA